MAATWRDAALEQAELVSDRLRRLASSGLHFLHNEFGLDLGVNPELWPSWVILVAALIGLLLVVWWVVACGGAARKKRGAGTRESSVKVNVAVTATDSGKTPPVKAVKPEEPKKKNKKKSGEKQKTQPNGRTAPESREEIKVVQEVPKQAPVVAAAAAAAQPPPQKAQPQPQPAADNKADKAKKTKKKSKPEVKPSQSVSTTDGKEPDEGAWETKISNREKRQQRRKEKGPGDESGSPGGGNHVAQQMEQPVVSAPASTKKNKASLNLKAEKAEKAEKRDPIVTAAPPSWNPVSSVNSGGWTEMAAKLPPQVSASDNKKWSVAMKTSGHRNSEPLAWGQESEGGSWTNMDGRIKKELNTVNFPILGLNSSAGDPAAQSATDLGEWKARPADNEWSGLNGLGAVDPSSDWSAPIELWGNYEEPKVETLAAKETPVSQPPGLQDSEDDKEKGDPSGSTKSKRKKKKKKKPEDENAVSQANTEVAPASTESSAVKSRPHVPQEEPAKQNVVPPVSQKKADQNWEQPKQVQKKKARRET